MLSKSNNLMSYETFLFICSYSYPLTETEEVQREQAQGACGAQRVPSVARHRKRRHPALLLRRPTQPYQCT